MFLPTTSLLAFDTSVSHVGLYGHGVSTTRMHLLAGIRP